MNGKLIHGNSLEELKKIPDNSVDTVITDPPYGLSNHSEKLIRETMRKWLSGEEEYIPTTKGFMAKCYDKETEILTENGWKNIKDIVENKIQTKVYTLNQETQKIELQSIKQYHKYKYKGEMYRFTGRSVDLKVTPNHHLVIEAYPSKRIKFIEAQNSPKSFVMLNTGVWEGIRTNTITINGVKYPIKEFMFFFGIFLGDGFVVNRKKHKQKQDFMGISVYKKTIKKRKPIEKIIKKLNLKYNFTSDTQILIYDKNLIEYFKQFGKAKDKYIPKEFFKYDKEILIELYNGLMLTDGHTGKKGKVLQYSSISKQLINDIQQLVFLIGRSSTFNKIRPSGIYHIGSSSDLKQESYRLTILKENKKLWFEKIDHKNKKERLKKELYDGFVYDIGVEYNHTLYIRRNGKTVWSSNSWDAFVPPPALWKEVYRVMKPGGTVLVFAGSRTQDLMTMSLRLAGFEIKDTLMWLYGCVSEDTEILTVNGFKKMNELKEGEEIYNLNLQTGGIEKDKVLEKFIYDVDDDVFIINDYIKVSKNHKIIIKMFDKNLFGFVKSEELYEDFLEQGLFTRRGYIPLYEVKTNSGIYDIKNSLISYEKINKMEKVRYKGKVWSIRTNNVSYIARRNGKIFITGNSGFPKATDISKQIDKKLGKDWVKAKEFMNKLKEVRESLGLTKKQAFEKCFGTPNTFGGNSWYENGRLPTQKNYKKIKKELNLDDSFDDLFKEVKREIIGKNKNWGTKGVVPLTYYGEYDITIPTTSEATKWEGYKCVSEDTEILTIDGWKQIGEIKIGDTVFSFDMKQNIIVNKVRKLFEYYYEGKIINIKNRHTDQLVTPNHRIICKRYNRPSKNGKRIKFYDKKWRYIQAKDLDSSQYQIPVAGIYDGTYSIGEDMAELLGWVLSEGHYRKTSNNISISQSSVNKNKVDIIRNLLNKIGVKYKEHKYKRNYKGRKYYYHVFSLSAKDEKVIFIRKLLPDKKPIKQLWHLPINEKKRLYEGLMLGDGFRNKECEQFSQKDKEFLDWFQVFVALMGHAVKVNYSKWRDTIKKGKCKNYIGITMYNRKEVDYHGKIWSIETEIGNYIARRNGKIFITGNSHALKPAYEPIIWAVKKREITIIEEITILLGEFLWQLLVKLEKTDISNLQETVSILLNIVLLWNSILVENLKNGNMSTISMESKLTIELKILKSLLLKNTQENTDIKFLTFQSGIQKSQINGFNLLVHLAEDYLVKEKKKLKDILKVIVQENVTSKQKENGMSVQNVENDLQQTIPSVFIVLKSVILKLVEENPKSELKKLVLIVEKNLKQYLQESQQNFVQESVWENIEQKQKHSFKNVKNAEKNLEHQKQGHKSFVVGNVIKNIYKKIVPNNTPIILAMKPNDGSYADNALKWGVAGLNIDEGRIKYISEEDKNVGGRNKPTTSIKNMYGGTSYFKSKTKAYHSPAQDKGRFPANIILDEKSAEMLDEQSGYNKSGVAKRNKSSGNTFGSMKKRPSLPDLGYLDTGGASRFFYVAKASKKERNLGLEIKKETNKRPIGVAYNKEDSIHSEKQIGNNHPCLPPDELVFTQTQLKKIKEINIGDKVLTEKGTFEKVIDITKHYINEIIYEIKVAGRGLTTKATNNHPFLIYRPIKKRNNIVDYKIMWMKSEDLNVGDYILTPIIDEKIQEPINKNKDFWYLVGFWAAEGSFYRGHRENVYPVFSVHQREVFKIVNKLKQISTKKVSVYKKGKSKGRTICLWDSKIGEKINKLVESYAKTKKFKFNIWELPNEYLEQIFQGYIDGDGCVVRNKYQTKTISQNLAFQISFIAEKLGYITELNLELPKQGGKIGNRLFKKTNTIYHIRFSTTNIQNINSKIRKPSKPTIVEYNNKKYILRRIKEIKKLQYEGYVYNLTVENSPTFQTVVGMSHNTIKPLLIIDYLVRLTKMPNEDQVYLDPFLGSGTTALACELNNRKWIGIELEDEYIEIIKKRLSAIEEYRKLLDKMKKDKIKKGAKLPLNEEYNKSKKEQGKLF